jgi:hypothetical protein
MEERTVIKSYLREVGKNTFQLILTLIDTAGLVGLFIIVADSWIKVGYVLILVILLLWSHYSIFKKQYKRIAQLEASLATEQRSIDATLSLLTREITQNLEALRVHWENINQLSESTEDPVQKRLVLARQAIILPLPTFSYTIWETQTSLLTKALSAEQLQQVQAIYTRLKEILGYYSKLQALMDEQQTNQRADRWPDGGPIVMGVAGPPRIFDKNAPALWDSLEQIAHTLIAEGNPLEFRDHQLAA